MAKKTRELAYWVYDESNGEIEKYNILKHGGFNADLGKLKKEYLKGYKDILKNIITDEGVIQDATLQAYKEDFYVNKFLPKIESSIRYYFWAKCECEVVITSWPPFIEKEEIERLYKEIDENNHYREIVELSVGKKIDIYDQLKMNYDLFVDFLWKNIEKF